MPATKTKKRPAKKRTVKKKNLLKADDIGISSEHVIGRVPSRKTLFIDNTDNLPTYTAGERSVFHKPLASSRASFWLGTAFGILIIGVLALLAWQFIRVDLFTAGVLGL